MCACVCARVGALPPLSLSHPPRARPPPQTTRAGLASKSKELVSTSHEVANLQAEAVEWRVQRRVYDAVITSCGAQRELRARLAGGSAGDGSGGSGDGGFGGGGDGGDRGFDGGRGRRPHERCPG